MTPSPRAPPWFTLGIVLLGLLCFELNLRPHLVGPSTSFSGYWLLARELRAGTDAALFYDQAWLNGRLAAHGLPGDTMLGPPPLALTLLPWSGLAHDAARTGWMLFLLPCLLLSLWLLGRRLPLAPALALAAGFALAAPSRASFEVAQVYPLLLLLHVLGLEGWRRRASIGGLALAPLILLRGWHGLPQAFGWLWAGRPLGTLWALGGVGLGALLSLPLLGLGAWRLFAEQARSAPFDSETAGALAYQTWRSLALRLSTQGPELPDPALPGLHPWLHLGGALLILGLCAWAARRLDRPGSGLPFAAWTVLALLLAPFAEDHHFLLAALPVFLLWEEAPARRPLVLLALLLLLPAWPYDRPDLWGGWRSLLGYPRVWGMAVLLGALVWEGRSVAGRSVAGRAPLSPRAASPSS